VAAVLSQYLTREVRGLDFAGKTGGGGGGGAGRTLAALVTLEGLDEVETDGGARGGGETCWSSIEVTDDTLEGELERLSLR